LVTVKSKLNDLSIYQKRILDLASINKKSVELKEFNVSKELKNPLCGDVVNIKLNLINNQIQDLSAKVRGCALCEASAGLVVNYFTNENLPIKNFMEHFDNWLLNKNMEFPKQLPEELKIFLPIQDVKNRHVCIKMPFEAFFESINKK
tara:strand:+ start:144 stop:587 length:444 start_codon:yes stop_codon:yes gene_type:complete